MAEPVDSDKIVWQQTKLGPFIDRTLDQVYVCIGLHYVGLAAGVNETKPFFGDFLVVSSIRGPDNEHLNLTASGHSRASKKKI